MLHSSTESRFETVYTNRKSFEPCNATSLEKVLNREPRCDDVNAEAHNVIKDMCNNKHK